MSSKNIHPYSIIWSFLSSKAFNILLIFLLFSNQVQGQDKVRHRAVNIESNNFDKTTVQTGIRYMIPIKKSGETWTPCILSGISFKLPSIYRMFRIGMELDAGKISALSGANVSDSYKRVYIYQTAVTLTCRLNITNEYSIRPFTGVSRIRIDPHPEDNFIKNILRINSLENEFGLLAGIIPSWQVNKIIISLPLTMNRTFSSPERFTSFSFSIYAGGSF